MRRRPLPCVVVVLLASFFAAPAWSGPDGSALDDKRPSSTGPDESEPDGGDPSEGRWGLNAVPRFTLSNDEGFGLGVRGTAFWYRWDSQPYKTAISAQAFATTRFVQHHYLRVDAIDAFQLPLRIVAEAGYFQTLTFSYCGVGGDASCDDDAAVAAARRADLYDEDADRFVRRYHLVRYLQPYANGVVRWRLADKPHRPELIAGWRGHLYQPGDWTDEDGDGGFDLAPYPGSLYSQHFPDGEAGFASVVQLGASLDDRDHEPDPSRGYFVEASLRGAAPFFGSAWTFVGGNATLLLFVPLLPGRQLVLASRHVVDVLFGQAPVMELARVGGSRDYLAFGGGDLGRGLRQPRFPGAVKLLVQEELRTSLYDFSLFDQTFRAGGALFLDAGWIGASATELETLGLGIHYGFGVGLRVVWNESFVMRVDLAVSPRERFTPFLYTKPDHPY